MQVSLGMQNGKKLLAGSHISEGIFHWRAVKDFRRHLPLDICGTNKENIF